MSYHNLMTEWLKIHQNIKSFEFSSVLKYRPSHIGK